MEELQKYSIQISMTEDYKPTDNALAERVNGIIKSESVYRQERRFEAYEEALEAAGLKRVGLRRDQSGSGGRTYGAWLVSLGLIFKQDFSTLTATVNEVEIHYGAFLSAVINFLLIALVIFCIIKSINKMKDKLQKKEEDDPTTKICPFCKSEIDIAATRCPHCTSQLDD